MVNALTKAVRKKVKQEYGLNPQVEGEASAGWMLLDYGDLILHVFSPDRREFYRLEELWSEGKTVLHVQ
ncbi:MAG: Ribosomal silencing factor RsfS [Chloroflexi bacterium]|nr:Ribosomal silencing factor RsfS [Chloroflexota bacterium]